MTSSARHVFTLRHLVRRKFGVNRVEEALIGPQSFPACLSNAINQVWINWQYKKNLQYLQKPNLINYYSVLF